MVKEDWPPFTRGRDVWANTRYGGKPRSSRVWCDWGVVSCRNAGAF